MTYNSKRTIVSMVAGIILAVSYIIYALVIKPPASDDLKPWAVSLLVFIGMGIISQILIQIVFHIAFAIGIVVKGKAVDKENIGRIFTSIGTEDEMNKLISLKSSRIGYICAGVGLLITLAALALGVSEVAALHILVGSFVVGSLAEGCASVRFHERGVHNG